MNRTHKQDSAHLPSQRTRKIIITKRRGIAALTAAGIVLSAAVGAPSALATKVDDGGGYKTKDQRCEEIGGWFDGDVNAAAAADKAGDTAGREAAMSQARLDLALARGAGCDWAAARGVLGPAGIVVAPPIGGVAPLVP